MLGKGALPEKTILGVAFYGQTFNLVSKNILVWVAKFENTAA